MPGEPKGPSSDYAAGGPLSNRIPATTACLATRGIVPGMTGVTFAFLWGLGESDTAERGRSIAIDIFP
ncbi:hypothetical protein M2232_001836 [Bradyrhizobium japonicum]|nr:hypothetical protein [Bradyrhizobium japonicum]MCW2342918.1 hypothetical protein [Bradyrhizobium japonicum]